MNSEDSEGRAGEEKDGPVVLVVDDKPDNIDVLRGILRNEYRLKAALNGRRALEVASKSPKPDMIFLDVMMPEMDGYEVCRKLKENPLTADIPVIFVTARSREDDEAFGLSLGAVDYITKPIKPAIVKARLKTHLALSSQALYLEQLVGERTRELRETRKEIIRCLGQASEFKDNETGMHIMRMSRFTRLIGEAMGQDDAWVDLLFHASPMHDVGKIGIPDAILLKPGKLDGDEWAVMKRHTEFGAEIIGNHPSSLMRMAREIALFHHEKWDGSGYPHGLKGDAIPLSARIVAAADVFDALTSDRPYKKAWSVEDAKALIEKESGKHFDPAVCEAFFAVVDRFEGIRTEYAETRAPEARRA